MYAFPFKMKMKGQKQQSLNKDCTHVYAFRYQTHKMSPGCIDWQFGTLPFWVSRPIWTPPLAVPAKPSSPETPALQVVVSVCAISQGPSPQSTFSFRSSLPLAVAEVVEGAQWSRLAYGNLSVQISLVRIAFTNGNSGVLRLITILVVAIAVQQPEQTAPSI